jgi:anthranilate phosphoribosyltransferase
VLEALGIKLSGDPDYLKRSIGEAGVCFIHAPLFNQAFKSLAPIRKELGFRTVFNALGPLINPAKLEFQYTGVYNLELQRLYGYLLNRRNKKFAVVHSFDGYDELSLTDTARIVSSSGSFDLRPGDFSSPILSPSQIAAPASTLESAKLIEDILSNSSDRAKKSCVVANAGAALWFYHGAKSNLSEYVAAAEESINSERALRVLRRCQEL